MKYTNSKQTDLDTISSPEDLHQLLCLFQCFSVLLPLHLSHKYLASSQNNYAALMPKSLKSSYNGNIIVSVVLPPNYFIFFSFYLLPITFYQERLMAILREYVQKVTTTYHFPWCHFVHASIIYYLNYSNYLLIGLSFILSSVDHCQ